MSHCSGCSPLLEMKSCENLLVQARWTFYYIILINWRNLFVKKIFLLDSLLKLNVYFVCIIISSFLIFKKRFSHTGCTGTNKWMIVLSVKLTHIFNTDMSISVIPDVLS